MAQAPRRQMVYTVACRCGAHAAVHVHTFNRPQTCRRCSAAFTVTWKRDPKTGVLGAIVVAQARSRTRLLKPKPAPPPGSLLTLRCECGYSRQEPAAEAVRGHRCPGCGKSMIVEKPPGPKRAPETLPAPPSGGLALPLPPEFKRVGPAPAVPKDPTPSPVVPKSIAAPELPTGAQLVECPCGERILVRSTHAGKQARCPACDRALLLEKRRDPQTLAFTLHPKEVEAHPKDPLPVLEFEEMPDPAPAAPPQASPAAPASASLPGVPCACGATIPLEAVMSDSGSACPTCGRKVRMERVRNPQSMVVRLQPVFEEAEGQVLICQCGEELVVSSEDLGRHVQCPGCTALMEIEAVRDGTGAPALRAKLLAKLDGDPWSLEDFK